MEIVKDNWKMVAYIEMQESAIRNLKRSIDIMNALLKIDLANPPEATFYGIPIRTSTTCPEGVARFYDEKGELLYCVSLGMKK